MLADHAAGGRLLDGRLVSAKRMDGIRASLAGAGRKPTLATVLVGDDGPSRLYVGMKRRSAADVGIASRHIELPSDVSQAALEAKIKELVADDSVHGILVQLPLPKGLDAEAVIDLLPVEKDVDGLTGRSLGCLMRGKSRLMPCTPLGVMRLIDHYGINTSGARAVVVGRSTLVGLPMVLMLAARGIDATVTLAHSRTEDLARLTRDADIVVAAAGQASLIRGDMIKPGAAVFDVGVTRTEQGIRGDVDFDSVRPVAGWVTPMPGGTGPMTVACLLENTVEAAKLQGLMTD